MNTTQENTGTEPPTKSISSLSEFNKWVEEQRENFKSGNAENPTAFLYRGHSDKAYTLLPGAYRINGDGKSFRSVEYHLYQEMMRRASHEFRQDRTIFERLIRMQHYGLPTRLLDLTESPLVALFFACKDKADKEDGEILLFTPKRQSVYYDASVPEHAWVGLEKQFDFLEILQYLYTSFCKIIRKTFEISKIPIDSLREFPDFDDFYRDQNAIIDAFEKEESRKTNNTIHLFCILNELQIKTTSFFDKWKSKFEYSIKNSDKEKQMKEYILEKILETNLNRINSTNKIINNLKSTYKIYEKQEVSILHFLENFLYSYFIFPPINNERLKRQQGAFLLFPSFPMDYEGFFPPEKFKIKPPVRLLIPAKSKQKLIGELAAIGLTEGYLFPEMERQAQDIKALYPEQTPTAIHDADPREIIEVLSEVNANFSPSEKCSHRPPLSGGEDSGRWALRVALRESGTLNNSKLKPYQE